MLIESSVFRTLGRQPGTKVLRTALEGLVEKREPNEVVVVHHYTDVKSSLQLEVERRSETLGIHFERIILGLKISG